MLPVVLTLSDGVPGDDNTATDEPVGRIVDPGGLARPVLVPLPTGPTSIPSLQV